MTDDEMNDYEMNDYDMNDNYRDKSFPLLNYNYFLDDLDRLTYSSDE